MGDLVKVNSFASQQHVTKFVNILCDNSVFSLCLCGLKALCTPPGTEEFDWWLQIAWRCERKYKLIDSLCILAV